MKHRNMIGAQLHVPHAFEYANAAARTAATGFLPADVGKLAIQLDDFSFWVLSDDDPATWVAVGAGLSLSVQRTYWDADLPPVSAPSQNDEFNNASLDVKWTELDHDSILAVSEESTYPHVRLTASNRAGRNICGLAQAIPAGDFTITCKVNFASNGANYAYAGLALWQDLTATSDIYYFALQQYATVTRAYTLHTMSDRNTYAGARWSSAGVSVGEHYKYFRIRRNTTNYYYELSGNGINWHQANGAYNPAFTPAYFGIAVDNQGTGENIVARFEHFRYTASDVGYTALLAGKLASVYG